MEMDRQTIFVLFAAIIGLTLFGSIYLSGKPARSTERPAYSQNDIRYKFQQKELKNKNKKPAAEPIISTEPEEDEADEGDTDTGEDTSETGSGVEEGQE
jgi:hypothetical protein